MMGKTKNAFIIEEVLSSVDDCIKFGEDMECIICNAVMSYYFSKSFNALGLGVVDYWRCSNCGFTISKTHAEMSSAEWETLNYECHSAYQESGTNPADPRWLTRLDNQARILNDAAEIGILSRGGRWLDYACGNGKLAEILDTDYGLPLLKFDAYMQNQSEYLKEKEVVEGSFDFVITTSVFEHFTKREHFDFVERLVSDDGVLGIHTLVREDIPCDDTWFYLLAPHCAFHTNKSMEYLLRQWGYTASIYNVEAQLWLCFKGDTRKIEAKIKQANERVSTPSYIYKEGFVDYWK